MHSIKIKLIRVIQSCKTESQISSARTYLELWTRRYGSHADLPRIELTLKMQAQAIHHGTHTLHRSYT